MDEQPTHAELIEEINAMMRTYDGPLDFMLGNHDIRAQEDLSEHPKVALRDGNVVWVEFR